jgi:hypothetical protein
MHLVMRRWIQRSVSVCGWWLALGCVLNHAWAAPVLRCQFEVNALTYQHDFKPVTDPYTAQSVDLDGRFRFKAVMLADAQRVSLINLYVFYQTRRQPIILQHTKYVEPLAQRDPAPSALTGQVALYSPFLGKELKYACALYEEMP